MALVLMLSSHLHQRSLDTKSGRSCLLSRDETSCFCSGVGGFVLGQSGAQVGCGDVKVKGETLTSATAGWCGCETAPSSPSQSHLGLDSGKTGRNEEEQNHL